LLDWEFFYFTGRIQKQIDIANRLRTNLLKVDKSKECKH